MANQLSVVYQKAFANKPVLDSLLSHTAMATGAKPISNFKNPDTAVKKVEVKKEEDPGRKYDLDAVNDIARGRLVYGSIDSLRKGVEAFKKNVKQEGLKIDKESDFFKHPNEGYKGYHIDVKFPNGQTSEVQFHTAQTYAASMVTHDIHDKYGDEVPDNVNDKKKQVYRKVEKMPVIQANQLAQAMEQKTAPQQFISQIKAARALMGNQNNGLSG